MSMTLLATKLFAAPPPANAVVRSPLIARLDGALARKLTLVCAPAGFGKSTLLSAWLNACQFPSAWLSLDAGDGDPSLFLRYLVAALQTISDSVGAGITGLLSASPAPSPESVLTVLLNNLAASQSKLVLVLDDYHLVAAKPVDALMAFLIDHLPPQLHLVIATREEPELSLARLRAQGQLTELRQTDLRFAPDEAAGFLAQTMHLQLSAPDVAALDARTEGWVAGLQLAAISLQGHPDPSAFIGAFGGSHRFVQDYLIEEVLRRQSARVHNFLLCTSVLDRLCGPLCDAVMEDSEGQQTLDYLDQANLFIVALDNERRWFRYHHLFADLLREKLREKLRQQQAASSLHVRASSWYEAEGLEIDAFRQAVAGADIPRAMRLIDGNGMPLYFRGEMVPIMHWLQNAPRQTLAAHPSLWVTLAWSLLMAGQSSKLAAPLSSAEAALQGAGENAVTLDLRGQVAAIGAWSAVYQNDAASIHAHATLALALLSADNHAARTAAQCALGVAFLFRNERAAAGHAFAKVLSASESSGNVMFVIVASIALAGIQVNDNDLRLAADTYRGALRMITDPTNLVGCEAHLGLARILYEWNELEQAESHALQSSKLAARVDSENGLGADALLARMMLTRDDTERAAELLQTVSSAAKTQRFAGRMKDVAAVQIAVMLRRDELAGAAHLAAQQQLPLAQARVLLAQGDGAAALSIVDAYRRSMLDKGQANEALKAMVVQALALDKSGQAHAAQQMLRDALVQAEPAGFIRLFVDEGAPMTKLLSEAANAALMPNYVAKLLSVSALQVSMNRRDVPISVAARPAPLAESYSPRELEILRLIHQGRSNQEIGAQLFLSLSTVKWHNQNIFAKLQVQRRTEAVARALALNLLPH